MAYNIGTYISFKKTQTTTLFRASTEAAVGSKVLFVNWLQAAATLDLPATA